MINYFNNFGFLREKLPERLYNSLIEEVNTLKTDNFISGISAEGVPNHHFLDKNNNDLFQYLIPIVKSFTDHFGWPVRKYLTNDVPINFDAPWVNFHKQTQYFPLHSHNGAISYAIWLSLPSVTTQFYFHYLDTIGNIRKHEINLTKEDNGSLIMFPSTIMHGVNPFYNCSDVRITMSGNISLKVNNE